MDPRKTIKTLLTDLEDQRFRNRLFIALCGVPMSANEAHLVIDLIKEIAEIDYPESAGTETPSDRRAAHAYTLSALGRELKLHAETRAALLTLADAADTVGVAHYGTDDMSPEVTAMQSATQAARAALR